MQLSTHYFRSVGSIHGRGLSCSDSVLDVSSVSRFCEVTSMAQLNTGIRLAFVTLKNNLMVLSLRAMMMQFVILMCIAAFCFCGFLYALWTCVWFIAVYRIV